MSNGAVVAAAARAARKRQEEESMATYSKEDLEGWEFKIVRSATGRFKNYERVQEVCQEEAKAGWELVEKFDNERIRFKRRVERRGSDGSLGIDPYRTNVGLGEGSLAALVMVIVGALVALGVLFAKTAGRKGLSGASPAWIPLAAILLVALVFVIVRLKR